MKDRRGIFTYNNGRLWVFLACVAVIFILFIPFLMLGKVTADGDLRFGFLPLFDFYQKQLIAGGQFMWTNSVLGGFPIYLEPSGGFYSPVHLLLFKNFPVLVGYNLALFIATCLVFLFSFLFARSAGISRYGSFISSIVFVFGYHNSLWSGNVNVVSAFFILPLLLYCISKIAQGKYWYIFLGGFGAAYAFISGQPQWLLMGFVGAGLYVLYIIYDSRIGLHKLPGDYKKAIIGVSAIGLLSIILVLPNILFYQEITQFSGRSGGLSLADAQLFSQTPFDWLRYIFPEIQFKYLNAEEQTLYIGVIPLILAVIAGYSVYTRKDKGMLFVVLFLFGLIAAIKYSPIFWFLHQLPVFNLFRGANRWMYVGNFGLAMLTGIGFDMIVSRQIPQFIWDKAEKYLKWTVIVSGGVTLVSNILFYAFSSPIIKYLQDYYDKNLYQDSTKLPLSHYHNAISSLFNATFNNISILNIKFIIPFVFLIAGFIFVRFIKRDNLLDNKYFGVIVIVLVVSNLLVLHPNFNNIVSRNILEPKSEIADFIIKKENGISDNFRVLSILTGSGVNQKLDLAFYPKSNANDRWELQRDIMEVNFTMTYGLDTIDGCSHLMTRRVARLLAILGSRCTTAGDNLAYAEETIEDKLSSIVSRLPVLSMLNVKYIISLYELPSDSALKLIYTAHSTRFNVPVYLYENKEVLSRVYFSQSTNFIKEGDEKGNYDIITKAGNDFSKNTFIECDFGCTPGVTDKRDVLSIKEYREGYLSLSANVAKSRWLVFSESNFPGWRITVDGKPVETRTANYLFHGIYILSGKHDVIFEYGGI